MPAEDSSSDAPQGIDSPNAALIDPDILRQACGRLSVPGKFLGQGFFPRRYRVSLRRPPGGQEQVPWRPESFEPQADALPFVDEALRILVTDKCRFLPRLLATALPGQFAGKDPGDVSFLIEFY